MGREKIFRKWLINWQPKNANVNFKKNVWKEETLVAYMNVLKNIVTDLKIDDKKVKKNLLDYGNAREYTIIYKRIINHVDFKTLQYFPLARKTLKRYLDFLYDSK